MVEMNLAALCKTAWAARDDARKLRDQSFARRVECRRALALAARRLTTAEETYAGLALAQDRGFRSAWSDLQWRMVDGDLDHVLVSHDGEM
ncbi:MAG: hypothetical protein ACRDLE_13345 [Gaiellaceae bacterium]